MFKDISKFNNLNDYLPILSATIIIDVIFQLALYYGFFLSSTLNQWYKEFRLSAVLSDICIILIGFIIARYFYNKIFEEFNIIKFIILLLVIQIIHDILFYLFIIKPIPKGKNQMFDLFKKYSKEHSFKAIIGDSLMMISSALLASYFANYDMNTNIIILIISLYTIPYTLFTNYVR